MNIFFLKSRTQTWQLSMLFMLLLMSFLALMAPYVQAQTATPNQWEEITEASTPALRFYIDKNSIHHPQQAPQWINVIILSQTSDPMLAPPDHQSDTTDMTIDCQNQALRINVIHSYNGRNATGEITQTLEGNQTFIHFSTEDKDAQLFNYICKQ